LCGGWTQTRLMHIGVECLEWLCPRCHCGKEVASQAVRGTLEGGGLRRGTGQARRSLTDPGEPESVRARHRQRRNERKRLRGEPNRRVEKMKYINNVKHRKSVTPLRGILMRLLHE